CEAVSRALSDELDRDEFIDDAYYLEVSSPGLGRQLKKDKHFEKSIGEEVELKTFKPIDKVKEFEGLLKSFDAETVTLDINGKDVSFNRKDIAKINLKLDF
ncbi:MAG: ribosome maturation factor RimP, partial [Lachnospiraceae bacterium]|nr:ribosome maturation factor RimP [Lachnospiraceae bacterium]